MNKAPIHALEGGEGKGMDGGGAKNDKVKITNLEELHMIDDIDNKLDIILKLIANPDSAAEISKKYGIGISTLYKWRSRFIQSGKQGLKNGKTGPQPKQEYAQRVEQQKKELEQHKKRIAELAAEVEILKKNDSLENEEWT